MMRTLFVPLAPSLASGPALEAAFFIAKRMNSHIRAMFVRPDPDAAIASVPMDGVGSSRWGEAIEREGRQAAAAERASFEAWRSRHQLPEMPADNRLEAPFASWAEEVGEIEPIVTRVGRVSDLIVMSRFAANDVTAERCFDAAVFNAGRPTLVVPRKLPADLLDHVTIAWNGSLEASHAVFGAMAFLRAAHRVSIFSVAETGNEDAGGDDLAEVLSWCGIPTRSAGHPKAQSPTGAALLTIARRSETTLIVMGAYTHSRLRQAFLGGVTRQVLSEAEIPVLMSH